MAGAYQIGLVDVEATPGEGTTHLCFYGPRGEVLFAVTLELDGCHEVAEACARAIAKTDFPTMWVEVPNPNSYQRQELIEAQRERQVRRRSQRAAVTASTTDGKVAAHA